MSPAQIDYIIHHLKEDGVSFDAGLTTEEIQQVEQAFGLRFPPDLRAFLQVAMPVSDGFVPWRRGLCSADVAHEIVERLHWPADGIVFDVIENNFWLPAWGARPDNEWQWETVARQYLADYPQLIPIFSHRYIPESPHEVGNPVFSVYGSDIIYYGYDLFSYFVAEFTLSYPLDSQTALRPKPIEFWSDFDEPRDISWGYEDES